jgi:hypothetical protein
LRNYLFIFIILLLCSFKRKDDTPILDPLNIDVDLIKQSIVDVINERRIKRKQNLISIDPALDSVVNYFSKKYEKKKLYKRKRKLKRNFYQISRNYGFFNSWFKVGYNSSKSLYNNGRAYTLIPEEGGYYYGTNKQREDTAIIRKALPRYTYKSFARNVLRKIHPSRNRRWIGNSEVIKIGMKIKIIKKNYPSTPPRIEVLFVLSGNVLPQHLE